MYLRSGTLAVALLLGGCAGGPPKPGPETLELTPPPDRPRATSTASDHRDPFQGVNRAMWAVNYDALEPYVARPAVHGYAHYVPQEMKDGIENLVDNFDEPSSMVNHLLTGDLKGAGTNLGRFTLNTTFGLLGIFDVAKHTGLERNMLEMDTVLGKADIGYGAYIMVPVYGPTTTRELVGDTIDTIYFPYALLTFPLRVVHWALDGLGTRAKLIDQERIIDNALDPYALTKDFYLQYNEGKVTGRQPELKQQKTQEDDGNLDEYLDEIDK